jgi:hypothetical protein
MRIFSVALLLMIAGCRDKPAIENQVSQAKPDDQIDCAIGGMPDFTKDCAIERSDGTMLTLRHRDGGFRRLTLEPDGTIDTADGADGITVQTLSDGRTEVTVGADRYRLPASF